MPYDDHDQGHGDQNDRRRNRQQRQQGRQNRPGDVLLDDSFTQRFLFRALTDVVGDAGLGLASAPTIQVALQALSSHLGPQLTQVLITGVSAAAQNPRWLETALTAFGLTNVPVLYASEVIDEAFDGVRRSIRTEQRDGQTFKWVNENDAQKAIADAREKYKVDRPPPHKSYREVFLGLLPPERLAWDQILAAFTPEQKTKFGPYKPQFGSVEMMRAALEHAAAASATNPSVRATALIAFCDRHFDPSKMKGAAEEVSALVGKLSVKAAGFAKKGAEALNDTIDKLGEPLTPQEEAELGRKKNRRKRRLEALGRVIDRSKW